jgi:hypothetical protein
MSNQSVIRDLCETAGKLREVRYSLYDAGPEGRDWIVAVEMRFESRVASIYAESELDTISVRLGDVKVDEDCYLEVASKAAPWIDAVGRSLRWIWLLQNQEGYEDGVRFEFAPSTEGQEALEVTLLAIASGVRIYICRHVTSWRPSRS